MSHEIVERQKRPEDERGGGGRRDVDVFYRLFLFTRGGGEEEEL